MKTIVFIVLTLLFCRQGFCQSAAQDKYREMLEVWNKGLVFVNDTTVLDGELRFNNFENSLMFKNANETKIFKPKNILGFEFDFPERRFISASLKDDDFSDPYFFEVLVEGRHFALLRYEWAESYKKPRQNAIPGQNLGDLGSNSMKRVVESHREYYIFNDIGERNMCLDISDFNHETIIFPELQKRKKLYMEVFKNQMKDDYNLVKGWAKKLSYHFSYEDELILIIEYYKSLEKW